MTPRQAAKIIGCHTTSVIYAIKMGYLKAKKLKLKKGDLGFGRHKFRWDIHHSAVKKYAEQIPDGRGGRGKARKTNEK